MSAAASAEEAARVPADAEVVLPAAAVDAAYARMAHAIQDCFAGQTPVVLACMIGGLIPTVELLRRIEMPLELDYVHATRYRQGTSGHEVEWRVPPPARVRGRQVLVVDDILDEGHTLAAILAALRDAGAAEVHSAVLVEKRHERRVPGLGADFVGGSVPDRYVFGCGMDYKGWHRQLPAIHAVAGEASG